MASQSLTRRSFLCHSGLALSSCLALSCGRLPRLAAKDESEATQPIMRFWQWNDVHVQVAPGGYPLHSEKMRWLVAAANDDSAGMAPDFVLGVGDMIHGVKPESRPAEYDALNTMLADLRCPYYPLVGNHETVQTEESPEVHQEFLRAYGRGNLNYTFSRGGILFVMLDDSGMPMSNGKEAGRRRREWLAETLRANSGRETIICCHIPLVPVREEKTLAESFGFVSYTARDDEMLAIVESHADSVLAVLSGHLHLTGVAERNGIYHIVPCGTASYPCDYAHYEVYPDRIHVRMVSLPSDLVTPASNIHGHPRWETDYIDDAHPAHELYMKGNTQEREFDIARRGK